MGLTFLTVAIARPEKPTLKVRQRFLVDSGASYSVVPSKVLGKLGIKPSREEEFTLANGETVRRKLGFALFEFQGRQAPSTVIFGEEGDASLLGTVTLEELGLLLDPLRRELRPLPTLLGKISF